MTADDLHYDLEGVLRFLQHEHPAQTSFPPASHPSGQATDFPLDPNQRLAATHLHGPMRVMAPAGSGKTRTLVSRIIYLLDQGIPAERILALAFNRKAQQEMNDRLAELGHAINVRTFHSFGYEIVRRGLGWTYHENSQPRWLDVLRKAMAKQILPSDLHHDVLEPFLEAFRRATMELVPLHTLKVQVDHRELPYEPIFNEIITAQTQQQFLTFDGMIYFALRVLLDDAALRHSLQTQFEFVLVDEFQDLNRAQMLLTQIIALPQNNLFVVGDDDQMIYGWRGADVRLILDFPTIYPNAKTVILATNYRSTSKIVQHSRRLIEHNPERVAKDIVPRSRAGRGTLDILLASGIRQQAKAALDWMDKQKALHALAWEDFAILYRANSYVFPLIPYLDQGGIPYTLNAESPTEEEDLPEIQPSAASPEKLGGVNLMTIHKSKGKEFPFVVYFNLSKSGSGGVETSVPEERRVAYVGATRAQQGLLITADEEHYSHFLVELALHPEFEPYALPFIERQAEIARKKTSKLAKQVESLRKKIVSPSRISWWPWRSATVEKVSLKLTALEKQQCEAEDRLDMCETEIRFRKILSVKQEHKNIR